MKIKLNIRLLSTLMAFVIASASSNILFADDMKGKHKEQGKEHFEKMAKELNLSEQQKKDLQPIMKKHRKERMETMKAMHDKHSKELATVLNEEQMEKLKEMRQEKMKHMMHGKDHEDEIED